MICAKIYMCHLSAVQIHIMYVMLKYMGVFTFSSFNSLMAFIVIIYDIAYYDWRFKVATATISQYYRGCVRFFIAAVGLFLVLGKIRTIFKKIPQKNDIFYNTP